MAHIHFINHATPSLASVRMRVERPIALLRERGHKVTTSDTAHPKADVSVFQKHLNPAYDQGMASLLKGKSKIVFDISDDHFDKAHGEHYKTMINIADMVTVNGKPLMEKTKQFIPAGGVMAYIKDPITFPYGDTRFLNLETPRLIWYGHITNFGTMGTLASTHTLGAPLTVVTNKEVTGDFAYIPWEIGKVESIIHSYDIVLLPLAEDKTKHTKNTNRAVDALQAGKFVVTDSEEVYGELKDFIYIGDIADGIEWAKSNPKAAIAKTTAGQDYVRQAYNSEIIGNQWEDALTGEITLKQAKVR